MNRTTLPQTVSWRRVGALSSTFSLHVLAIAASMLAMARPPMPPEPTRREPPALAVELLQDPPPVLAPVPPPRPGTPPATGTRLRPRGVPGAAPVAVPVEAESVPVTAPVVDTGSAPGPREPSPGVRGTTAAVAYREVRPPDYPHAARLRGWEGETLLRVLVGADGRPRQVHVERSSGHSLLDRAAVHAVRGWRFHPAQLEGVARDAWTVVPVAFRLDQG